MRNFTSGEDPTAFKTMARSSGTPLERSMVLFTELSEVNALYQVLLWLLLLLLTCQRGYSKTLKCLPSVKIFDLITSSDRLGSFKCTGSEFQSVENYVFQNRHCFCSCNELFM